MFLSPCPGSVPCPSWWLFTSLTLHCDSNRHWYLPVYLCPTLGCQGIRSCVFFYLLGYTSYLGAFFIPEGRSWRGDLKSPSDSVLAELPSCWVLAWAWCFMTETTRPFAIMLHKLLQRQQDLPVLLWTEPQLDGWQPAHGAEALLWDFGDYRLPGLLLGCCHRLWFLLI